MWLVASMFLLWRALDAADEARGELDGLRSELSVDSLVDGSARERLTALHDDLRRIEDSVSSPVAAPARLVPGLGRQLRSADALGAAGVAGTGVGLDVLDELDASLEGSLPTAGERIALLDRVTELLADGRAEIADLDLGPDGPLLSTLADARVEAEEGIAELERFLGDAEAVSRSLRSLLADGDHLLLVANNAEMRSGSGMFLQAGALDVVDGSLDVDDLRPSETIQLPRGAVAAESPTYQDLWGFLEPTVEWRNLAASPRFEVTAELATRMWEGLGNERPRGVIAVDPFALAAILRATGPVVVDGDEIDADEVVPLLLHDQYDVFIDATDDRAAQDARRDRLGQLADATFEALGSGDVDPVKLISGLRDAVRRRHILAWSAEPAVQQGWVAAGMAGELDVDSIMVSLLNRGANKLDPFVSVDAEIKIGDRDGVRLGVVEITVRNDVPDGEVAYVAGPADGVVSTTEYGQYSGILAVSLPGVARNALIEGVESLEVARPDGPVLSLATKFVLDRGTARTFRVVFDLPVELETIRIEPDARPQPVEWRYGGQVITDGQHHRLRLPRPQPAG